MNEYCPLGENGHPALETNIPLECLTTCERRWSTGFITRAAGSYDAYSQPNDGDCQHENSDIEFSADSLRALGRFTRQYAIVDLCTDCEEEIGEQRYPFTCPLPIEE